MTADRLLTAALTRFARRSRWVQFVAAGVVAAAAAALLTTVAVVAGFPVSWLMAGTGAAAAIGLAAAWSYLRTPPVRQLAHDLDTRLHLSDSLVSALQFADPDDERSTLVARDALARLARLAPMAPAQAFPVRVPLAAAVLVTLTFAVPFVLFVAELRRTDPYRAALEVGARFSSVPWSGARAPAGMPVVNGNSEREMESSRTPFSSALSPAKNAGPSEIAPAASRTAAALVPAGTPGDASAPGASAGRGPLAGSGGAASEASTAAAAIPAPMPSLNGATYRARWSKGQAAVAREDIPLEMRAAVGRYFAAIRPQGQP